MHESENSTNEDEKVTCVDEPNTKNVVDVADDDNDVNGVDGAPLASMESDPAPLASLESSTTAEMPSMWLFVRLYNYTMYDVWMNLTVLKWNDMILCIFVKYELIINNIWWSLWKKNIIKVLLMFVYCIQLVLL